MHRRRLLRTVPAVASLSAVAGCMGLLGRPDLALRVRNRDERRHEYEITADGDFQNRATTGALDANESTTEGGFIPRLDYNHTPTLGITVDGSHVRDVDLWITSSKDVTVDILNRSTVEVGPSELIFSDGPSTDSSP